MNCDHKGEGTVMDQHVTLDVELPAKQLQLPQVLVWQQTISPQQLFCPPKIQGQHMCYI